LARRQMKWFRRWGRVRWLRGDATLEELISRVL
jgi:tRNA A37 N6-isopentenylltransferase MiaA